LSFYGRVSGYIRAHPILLLALLSPGIPEYLSGSSSWAILVVNPIVFAIFVLLNLGLYTMGVVLIREAVLRWQKGWASIFLLGIAYGIVEEGLALQTLFNPNAQPVGSLGIYGHWMGVNWVWTTGLLLFHATISIGLPLLLFGLALPNLRGKSLLSSSRQKACVGLLTLDCIVLFGIVRYWPGWPIVIGSFLAIFSLVYLAHRLPSRFASPIFCQPKNPRRLLLTGLLFFPAVLLTGVIGAGAGIPPIVTILLDLFFASGLLLILRRSIGSGENGKQKIALAIGLVLPILLFGFVANIGAGAGVPPLLTTLLDLVFALGLLIILRRSIGSGHNGRQKMALAIGVVLFVLLFGFVASLALPIVTFADVGFLYFIRRLRKRYSTPKKVGTAIAMPDAGPIQPTTI
jgi:hypothetical protein